MSSDYIGTPTPPLQTVIPSYLYSEYSDDENLQAFVDAYNSLAQSYLGWFNSTPLAIYTHAQIAGPLLDWIATGIYGVERPVFASNVTKYIAGLNSRPLNANTVNGKQYFQSGTATIATDDYYKRVLTWTTYIGDGRYFNVGVLRKRVARFLYGVNGTDITPDQVQSVSVEPTAPTNLTITVPAGTSSTYFAQAIEQGILEVPFMLQMSVIVA